MIKEYKAEFFERVLEIFVELFKNPPFSYDWMTRDSAAEYLSDMINTPKSMVYVLANEDEIIGACFGAYCNCGEFPVYEIKEIFVDRNLQRSGHGRYMLKAIERKLIKAGIGMIRLQTIVSIPAYDFYLKNGYTKGQDTVMMSKRIGAKNINN